MQIINKIVLLCPEKILFVWATEKAPEEILAIIKDRMLIRHIDRVCLCEWFKLRERHLLLFWVNVVLHVNAMLFAEVVTACRRQIHAILSLTSLAKLRVVLHMLFVFF